MIYLLKNRSEDSEFGLQDEYDACLDCIFVSVMVYECINIQQLIQQVNSYDSIIVTSQRAVDALKYILPQVKVLDKPVYTVGPATARRLKTIGFTKVYGEESGNGKELAKYMNSTIEKPTSFLFLAGEVHRKLLPDELIKHGHKVYTQIVYKTVPTVLDNYFSTHLLHNDWVVFFSPGYSDKVLKELRVLEQQGIKARIADIGTTTAEYLESQGFKVDAVATSQSDQVLKAVLN